MLEERLLSKLETLGWKETSKTPTMSIFSFELGIRYCLIDIMNGRVFAYNQQMEPSYLTNKEMSIFTEVSEQYHKTKKEDPYED